MRDDDVGDVGLALQPDEELDDAVRDDQGNVARGRIALPVAVLPDDLTAALGAETSVVRLSVADGAKQASKGRGMKGLPPADYAIVQQFVDRAEAILQGKADLVFQGTVGGKLWVAVLRRAATALTEVYLKSFHRIPDEQVDKNRTRGMILRRELPDPIGGVDDEGDD